MRMKQDEIKIEKCNGKQEKRNGWREREGGKG